MTDSDGDAFRLAVKLRISVLQPNRPEDRGVIALWDGGGGVREPTDPNPAAATRLAITRAAAEIGKGMK